MTKEEIWKLHNEKLKELTVWGLRNRQISIYDDELIKKLRTITYGGIPASIILLSNGMCNGHCYDRALLMATAFLDTEDDIKLICADIDSLRLNPTYIAENDPLYAEHCFLERTTKNGEKLIYDTSSGLVYDKELYWKIEKPKVNREYTKDDIEKRKKVEDEYFPEDMERDKYASTIILPIIEMRYSHPIEMYSKLNVGLLQREVEVFKKQINYDELQKEVEEDMKRLGFKS